MGKKDDENKKNEEKEVSPKPLTTSNKKNEDNKESSKNVKNKINEVPSKLLTSSAKKNDEKEVSNKKGTKRKRENEKEENNKLTGESVNKKPRLKILRYPLIFNDIFNIGGIGNNRDGGNGGNGGGGNKNKKMSLDYNNSQYKYNKRFNNPYYNDKIECDKIVDVRIESLEDLIKLAKDYDPVLNLKYNYNAKCLHRLIEPLEELSIMIGMKKVKENITNQVLFYLQDLDKENCNMMHTVLEGSPGVGKTTLGKILAKLYLKMGVVTRDYFRIVKRPDLIAQYLGQTAAKTQAVIDDVMGGVLFIDEAYSLGNPEKRDSFSKACLDTLNANLSEKKNNFVCIIAGYKDSLKNSFFATNRGLERRFPFRYTIDDYDHMELCEIFKKIVKDSEWELLSDSNSSLMEFFNKNKKYFKFNGGDMEILFQNCKISHAKRMFGKPKKDKKKLTLDDIKSGLNISKLNDEIKNRNMIDDVSLLGMYT